MSIFVIDNLLKEIKIIEEHENEYREIDIKEGMLADKRLADSHIKVKILEKDSDCAICLENITNVGLGGNMDPVVTNCGHIFHLSCLAIHVKKSCRKTCPTCRKNFD